MPNIRLRPTLLTLLAASLGIIVFAIVMLMSAQISRWERRFDDDVGLLVSDVKNKLDTNEAVLAGFSAFLQAVDLGDTESAKRYAASVTAAYPHIYMIEVARKVSRSDQQAFEASLRKGWRADFKIKDFSELTQRPPIYRDEKSDTWPILFMYPSLPDAQAIYGVRLESVDYLANSVELAHENRRPVVSPVFNLYEGGGAYILLQEVSRPARALHADMNFFGNTMMALLLIRTQALIPEQVRKAGLDRIRISAFVTSPNNAESLLFEREPDATAAPDRLFLPNFKRQLAIASASQPTTLYFERQLRWRELLSLELLTMLGLLGCALLVVPWLTIRHYLALDREEVEHERSAYLATHDLLTGLPNRFLFNDRLGQAFETWHRSDNAFALLLIDLDHFKQINDRHGHDVGDQVLVTTARRMSRELRSCDTVARLGGDEFVVLLANILNAEDARMVGEKLRAAIAEPIESSAGELQLSCSIGVAICPLHGDSAEILRKRADQAMYSAKQQGRNAVAVC